MDDNTNRLVGNNLRRERWIRDWSQAFVARQLDISIRTLSRAETGCGISKKILKKLCCLYQIPLAKLYDEKETSLDKGTQRKTTENELPSLTQCTA